VLVAGLADVDLEGRSDILWEDGSRLEAMTAFESFTFNRQAERMTEVYRVDDGH